MCKCSKYEHLEMTRKVISKRMKESKSLKKKLELLAKHPEKEHLLFKCSSCNQYWQGSRAWNWGNDLYLFKVPDIDIEDWLSEVYVQPDELLIYSASISNLLEATKFETKDEKCRKQDCSNNAIKGLVNCLAHHIASLQKIGQLPKNPTGRWFDPYYESNFTPSV